MNTNEYLMTQAASECNEVAHRISKALQFGINEVEPGQALTNAERIVAEFADLCGVMSMLEDRGLLSIDDASMAQAMLAKRAKVLRYMEYAKQQGTLVEQEVGATSMT